MPTKYAESTVPLLRVCSVQLHGKVSQSAVNPLSRSQYVLQPIRSADQKLLSNEEEMKGATLKGPFSVASESEAENRSSPKTKYHHVSTRKFPAVQ